MAASRFTWRAARSILAKARVTEAALACGPHLPLHEPTAQRHGARRRSTRAHPQQLLGQACRHARALRAAAVGHQRLSPRSASDAAARRCRRWRGGCASNAEDIAERIDGCGLPTFALPLDAVAEGCAKFAAAVADGDRGASDDLQRDGRASGIRRRHRSPRHRPDADRPARGCSRRSAPKASTAPAFRRCRLGVALKVEDGAKRAAEPALLAVLRHIDAIGAAELDRLHEIRGAGNPQYPTGSRRPRFARLFRSEIRIRDPRSERSP